MLFLYVIRLFLQSVLGFYDNSSFVLWPSCYFDEEWHVKPGASSEVCEISTIPALNTHSCQCCWWVARRGDNLLGLYCTHETVREAEQFINYCKNEIIINERLKADRVYEVSAMIADSTVTHEEGSGTSCRRVLLEIEKE